MGRSPDPPSLLSAMRPPPGTWFLRDWFWTALGLIVIDEFASRVVHSSGEALKLEAVVVVVPAVRGRRLRHRDVTWAALGAAAVYLYAAPGDLVAAAREAGLAAIAVAVGLALVRGRYGLHLIRALVALVGAAAAYGL